jgi:hypothetical protein
MPTLKLAVPLEVHVRVDSDGVVQHVSLPHDRTDLCALVQKQFPAPDLAKRIARATRSRLDEGLVRVEQDRGEFSYYRLHRCTKLHIILRYKDTEADVKFRRTGSQVNGPVWGGRHIEENDLGAINKKFPA